MSVEKELSGSLVPIVTPVDGRGRFDGEACDGIVANLLSRGVGGIVALGTTGEFSLVPPAMRREMLETLRTAIAGRIPLIVSCGRPSITETAEELREAEEFGADFCLVAPSYYLALGPDEVLREFAALQCDTSVPLLYYHIPARTVATRGAEIIRRLHAEGLICGLKDSGGPNPQFLEALLTIRETDPGFQILLGGSSSLLHAAAMGVTAVTSATGCIAPEIEAAVLRAVAGGRLAEAADAQRRLVQLIALILSANPENAAVGTKALLSTVGLCGSNPLAPFAAADAAWIAAAQMKVTEILGEFVAWPSSVTRGRA